LIRRIENNREIKPVELRTPLTNLKINAKCGVFADDVGAVVKNSIESINGIFKEYEAFSKMSGIQINESKTEIMPLNRNVELGLVEAFGYGKVIKLRMVKSIKICGIVYSNDNELEYKENVLRKDLEEIERFIFGFLWSKKVGQNWAPDRIKRVTLKQDYENGGLKIPDLKNLNSSLKLKQFLKASGSNHVIKNIQIWVTESIDYDQPLQQEYARITNIDEVVKVGQQTINELTDKMREEIDQDSNPQFMIDLLANTDVCEYLIRKNRLLARSFFTPLFNCGIENFKQLVMEANFPRSDRFAVLAKNVSSAFPKVWLEMVSSMESNASIDFKDNFVIGRHQKSNICKVTVKQIRNRLCAVLEFSPFTFERKLGIQRHLNINPFIVNRMANKSEHMRMIKFRVLHCDIFCKQRMLKFKLSQDELCDFCGQIETIKHLIWDCRRSSQVWQYVNSLLIECGVHQIIEFSSLFTNYDPINLVIEVVSTKVIQLILQIDRDGIIDISKVKSEIIFLGHMYERTKDRDLWAKLMQKCK